MVSMKFIPFVSPITLIALLFTTGNVQFKSELIVRSRLMCYASLAVSDLLAIMFLVSFFIGKNGR
jgi:ACR3 family arsenite transporter